MKQKYLSPQISMQDSCLESCILAASNGQPVENYQNFDFDWNSEG